MRDLIRQIELDIQAYVRVKAFVSLVTALISYAVMMYVDLPFADFWAFLIFFLNFIPTIGSIVATIFPCVLALVQFETLHPFFIVAISLTTIQFFVGYYLPAAGRQVIESKSLGGVVVPHALGRDLGSGGFVYRRTYHCRVRDHFFSLRSNSADRYPPIGAMASSTDDLAWGAVHWPAV